MKITFGGFFRITPATIMRCGPTFRLARTHPTHARSSGLETSLCSRSLADYTIDTHESEFSEATVETGRVVELVAALGAPVPHLYFAGRFIEEFDRVQDALRFLRGFLVVANRTAHRVRRVDACRSDEHHPLAPRAFAFRYSIHRSARAF